VAIKQIVICAPYNIYCRQGEGKFSYKNQYFELSMRDLALKWEINGPFCC